MRAVDILVATLGVVVAGVVAGVAVQDALNSSEPVVFILTWATAIYGAQVLLLVIAYSIIAGSKKFTVVDTPKVSRTVSSKSVPAANKKKRSLPRAAVFYSTLAIWAIIGWAIVAQSPSEEGIIWIALFAPLFLMLLGGLFGVMAFLVGFLPLKFLVLSTKELITQRSLAALGGVMGSIAVLGLASLVFLLPIAIDTHHGAAAGQFAIILAVLGIPGAYDVVDPTALLVARCITWAAIAIFVTIWLVARSRKAQKTPSTTSANTK